MCAAIVQTSLVFEHLQNRCFLTACVIDMAHVMEGLSFFTRPAHTLTKDEEEKIQSAEDEEDAHEKVEDKADPHYCDKFSYSRNYGESIGVFTSICYYQCMHPTILLCGSFYYIIKMYVDKYQITNQYTRPHIQFSGRARTTTTYIFTAMTLGQIGNVIYFGILVDGMLDVAIAMAGSALIAMGLLAIYVFQPETFKSKKSSNKLERSKSSANENELSLADVDPSQLCVYNPPHPDDIRMDDMQKEEGMQKVRTSLDSNTISLRVKPGCNRSVTSRGFSVSQSCLIILWLVRWTIQ